MANDLNKEELDKELKAFLDQMDKAEVPKGTRSKDELWAKIEEATAEEPAKESRVLWPWLAAAASIVLILGYFIFSQNSGTVEVATANGQTKQVELPDGTTVSLNAQSRLTYQADNPRNVSLEGEAFFEVTKGDDFMIRSTQGTVTVLGTSFTVLDRGSEYQVLCKTGRVLVEVPTDNFSEEITAGGAVIKSEANIGVTEINSEYVANWMKGELYFDNAALEQVVEELERQYDIEITLINIENKRFTGYITIGSLEESLAMVCEPLGLTFEITDEKSVTIRQD